MPQTPGGAVPTVASTLAVMIPNAGGAMGWASR
jgi:hypothetical protein